MKTIYKFTIDRRYPVKMPVGAKVINVDAQGTEICIWAIVDVEINTV